MVRVAVRLVGSGRTRRRVAGVHRIGPRAAVRDGEIVVRQVGNLSVTFDHRVVDGARAAAFVLALIGRLEAQ